jgi:hypothetical protein
MIWRGRWKKDAPLPHLELPDELHGAEGRARAFGERRENEDSEASVAADEEAAPRVPMKDWISEMPHDSSEYLSRRRGPW